MRGWSGLAPCTAMKTWCATPLTTRRSAARTSRPRCGPARSCARRTARRTWRFPIWQAVSLTENIEYLESPLQIHHAVNDDVVNIGYSDDLAAVLDEANKPYEFYRYDGGGHNINSPYFSDAMQRTIEFFRAHL